MSLFWKREKEAKQLIQQYFEAVDEAMRLFGEAMRCYLTKGLCDEFRAGDKSTHKAESHADDLRLGIEKLLYSRALLPESRGDILGLLETFDLLPNIAENVTFVLETEQVAIPEQFRADFMKLVELNLEAYRLVRKTVDLLFTDPGHVVEAVEAVDKKESESDRLERDVIKALFKTDIPKADLILLRDLVQRIGDIANASESVGLRLDIISLKKRV